MEKSLRCVSPNAFPVPWFLWVARPLNRLVVERHLRFEIGVGALAYIA